MGLYNCELLSPHEETDEWGPTSLTNQPGMMRTSSGLKYFGWTLHCTDLVLFTSYFEGVGRANQQGEQPKQRIGWG